MRICSCITLAQTTSVITLMYLELRMSLESLMSLVFTHPRSSRSCHVVQPSYPIPLMTPGTQTVHAWSPFNVSSILTLGHLNTSRCACIYDMQMYCNHHCFQHCLQGYRSQQSVNETVSRYHVVSGRFGKPMINSQHSYRSYTRLIQLKCSIVRFRYLPGYWRAFSASFRVSVPYGVPMQPGGAGNLRGQPKRAAYP